MLFLIQDIILIILTGQVMLESGDSDQRFNPVGPFILVLVVHVEARFDWSLANRFLWWTTDPARNIWLLIIKSLLDELHNARLWLVNVSVRSLMRPTCSTFFIYAHNVYVGLWRFLTVVVIPKISFSPARREWRHDYVIGNCHTNLFP